MNKVRHIALYICLTLIISAVAGLFVIKPFTVAAEDDTSHTHDDGITFTAWTDTTSLPDSGSYYLKNDVTLSVWWEPSANITLCLNGHTITYDGLPIRVQSGITLGIYDCQGNGAVTTAKSYCIRIFSGGTANIYGGTFNGPNDANVATIYVEGTVTIENASVFGQQPVQIWNGGMGTINGGTFESTGSATIDVQTNASLKITGGTFIRNTGGNIIQNQGTLEMSGGTIGRSSSSNGAVGIVNSGTSATAAIKNVTITTEGIATDDDTKADKGLRNDNGGTMTVENCNITSGNWAVWNTGSSTIKISGGTFKGRYGIYDNDGTFELSGSPTFAGSTADIYLSSGQKIMVAGTLGNAAPYSVLTATDPAESPVVITDSSDTSNNNASKFTSKNSSYIVRKNSSGQLELAVPATYTITYDKGTGSDIMGSVPSGTKTEGTDFTLSSQTFTRTGYTQTGWSTTDGGAKEYDLGGTYTDDADITLYPYWTDDSTDNGGDNTGDGTDSGESTSGTTDEGNSSGTTGGENTSGTTAGGNRPSGGGSQSGTVGGVVSGTESVSDSSDTETVTVTVENKVTGDIQNFTVTRDGETITVDLGKENDGLYANVYNTNSGDFVTAALIEDGKAVFTLAKGIKFNIVIDSFAHGEDVSANSGIYAVSDVVETAVPVIGFIVPAAVSAVYIMKLRRKRNG